MFREDVNFSITNVTDSSRRVSTARQHDKFTSVQLSLGDISTTSVTSAITTSPGVMTSRSSHVVASTATATSGGGGGAGMSARESTAEAAMTSTEASQVAALPAIVALTVAVSVGLIVIALLLFLPWYLLSLFSPSSNSPFITRHYCNYTRQFATHAPQAKFPVLGL